LFAAGILIFLGVVIFPAGWHHMYVRRICGDDADNYDIGQCEMRWAYILAIVAFFVVLMLAIMAFCLACNQPRRWKNRDVVKRARKPGLNPQHSAVELYSGSIGYVPPTDTGSLCLAVDSTHTVVGLFRLLV